ncbi:MAG TPA: DUF4097 family beta strand repeat-containing protein [Ktedonobacteraceae bacterium]|nr:DUF4097 family beta strand repeat-containing protein [Ktedonobacteraceae bacterium]
MSRQESMFYPPEQSEREAREERRMGDEKLQPRPRGRVSRGQFALLGVVLAVALLFLLGLGVKEIGTSVQKTTVEPTLSYTVPATSHLVVHTQGGDVQIHEGGSNTIIIKATKHSGIFDSDTSKDVSASQNGDTVDVTAQVENHLFLLGNVQSYVTLDITVPANCGVQVNSDAGNIDIADANVQAALHTDAGNITMTDAHLAGTSSAMTDAGNITFSGSLDARGSYTFNTKAGNIDVTLPGNDAVNLHAQSLIGKVDNEFGNAAGSPPQAPVTISTGAGNITIHKQ